MMRARNHRPSQISFDEQFYPARPRSFRRRQPRPNVTAEATQRTAIGLGLASSAAIGTRPQLAIVIVPLFIALLLWTRDLRKIAT